MIDKIGVKYKFDNKYEGYKLFVKLEEKINKDKYILNSYKEVYKKYVYKLEKESTDNLKSGVISKYQNEETKNEILRLIDEYILNVKETGISENINEETGYIYFENIIKKKFRENIYDSLIDDLCKILCNSVDFWKKVDNYNIIDSPDNIRRVIFTNMRDNINGLLFEPEKLEREKNLPDEITYSF